MSVYIVLATVCVEKQRKRAKNRFWGKSIEKQLGSDF